MPPAIYITIVIVFLAVACGCDNSTRNTPEAKPRTTVAADRSKAQSTNGNASADLQSDNNVINVNSIRLYLPDELLGPRVGSNVQPLADYIKSLENRATEYWSAHDSETANGLLIAIGVKPNGESRAWCDAIDGTISDKTLRDFEAQMALVASVKVKDGPIAFAIEVSFAGRSVSRFPELPAAWSLAARNANKTMMIPDDLFAQLWPDP